MKKLLPFSLLWLGLSVGARAQTCGTTISAFPYYENFEGASAANWSVGGTSPSWVLGTPAKTTINSAGGGTKSWVTGLTGGYNANEKSFVESPCFNMSSLTQPVVEFKLWWSSEFSFDGAVLQSSIDGGTTWQNVGVKGEPNNWFNDNSINGAPGGQPAATAEGWTGINTSGSGGWVLAKHALTGLGGKPNVKLRFAFGADGNTVLDDGFAFDNFTIYENPVNDAGVTSITAPVISVVPNNPQPISVTLKNFAAGALTSAKLAFSVNGVVQPDYQWNGSLANNSTSAPFQIGTFSFPAGVHKLKAWSKQPNGAVDGNPSNDTVLVSINSCNPLSGAYTINKTLPASATNYTSFNAIVQVLGNCGVSGPVTITVAPNTGPYLEQVILPVIGGASATNSVTFEGSGNTVSGAGNATHQGIFTFNGTDYVKLNNLKIAVDASATTGWAVQLKNAADNDAITNCTIEVPLTSISSALNGIGTGTTISGAGNHANGLLVQNNVIKGGYYGVLVNGNTATGGPAITNNRIIGNQILDSYSTGVYLSNAGNGTVVENNDISRPARTSSTTYTGIYLLGNTFSSVISKNRIHNTFDAVASTIGSAAYGMNISATASAGAENIVKNNLIYNINNSGGSFYALYLTGGNGVHFYHNSIGINNPAIQFTSLRGLYVNSSTANNVKFNNNVLAMASPATSKHAIYLGTIAATLTINYNDLYVGSAGNIGYLNTDMVTLNDWKAAALNAYDQNSVAADPQYLTQSNLQPLGLALNNAGMPLPAVTDDFNGVTRSSTTPDLGAFEFTPAAVDAGVTTINSPTSPATPGSQTVQVSLKNFGTSALTSATIGWSVNGLVQPNYAWAGNLASMQTTTTPVTIGTYNFAAGNYTLKVWSKNPNNGTDPIALNDTTTLQLISCAALTGTYTVNKNVPASATNFQSISAAAERLASCGVSGPVTITVAPNSGPYTEQVEILNILNASATNTVTFEGNGNTVSTTPGVKPGIFVLNGAKYVKLNNFVISLPATATTGWGIQLINATDFNTISNNTINLPITVTTNGVNGIMAGTTSLNLGVYANNTKIQNNVITGGYYGVLITGNTGGVNGENNEITNNQFKDSHIYPIYLTNAKNTLVEGNDISRPARNNGGFFYGVFLTGPTTKSVISKNRIHNTHDAGGAIGSVFGIYNAATASLGNENIIKNNLIYKINNGGSAVYGLYHASGDGSYYFHNTVATEPSISYTIQRGVFFGTAASNLKLINNNISLRGSGAAIHGIYLTATTLNLVSNNNNLDVGTGVTGYAGTDKFTLADWQAVNSNAYDQNSVSTDPVFANLASGNLKPTSGPLDNKGQVIPGITEDILGAARHATTPDIGAYEFGVPANDVGITAVTGPNTTGCGMTANETVSVTIRNFGSNTQTSIPVTYTLNGTGLVSETYTGTLASNATATYTFTVPANLSVPGNHRIIASTNLSGDINLTNNADTLDAVNALLAGLPGPFNFETAATGINGLKLVTNAKSAISESAAASLPLAGQPATSTKGMIMEGVVNPNWIMPVGVIDPWTNNLDNYSSVSMCFNPAGGNPTDPLWLNFDLKQLYKTANANTNFRVTVNGAQVGPTYRPPFNGTGGTTDWTKVYVDLTSYKNLPTVKIALESSVAEAFANGAGTANLIDNIRIQRLDPTGVKDNLLAAQLHVFPNPSTGNFLISLPHGKNYQLEVTDLTGKTMLSLQAKGDAQLNLESAAKGVYLLKVSGENGTAVRKLIVE